MSHIHTLDEPVIVLARGVTVQFRRIEPGEFRMGARSERPSEEPVHRVRITVPFYLGIFPVTQAQFAIWTESAGTEHKNHFAGHANHPAENLDWDQANTFCEWLNAEHGQQFPGFAARLPTEAQWEYACRAGTETEYYTGDGEAALTRAGWFGEDWDNGSTHPVGGKDPNAWGLHDMHGNVWEWCQDVWDEYAYQRRVDRIGDPIGVMDGSEDPVRVVRGGSWGYAARGCRSAVRDWGRPGSRGRGTGFRVCLVPGPGSSPPETSRRSLLLETEAEGRGPESEAAGGAGSR